MSRAAHDKHGNTVHQGDLVEFVYGGDHHTAVVEELEEENTHHYARVTVSTLIPVTACSRRKDENPDDAPREGKKVVSR